MEVLADSIQPVFVRSLGKKSVSQLRTSGFFHALELLCFEWCFCNTLWFACLFALDSFISLSVLWRFTR